MSDARRDDGRGGRRSSRLVQENTPRRPGETVAHTSSTSHFAQVCFLFTDGKKLCRHSASKYCLFKVLQNLLRWDAFNDR